MTSKEQIDHFLEQNKGKPVVVVQGLGFVGAAMSLVCANALHGEYAVIGVDLPTPNALKRIQSINDGIFPIVASDRKIYEFYENSRVKKNFLATSDVYAYSKADVIIVDINLDVAKQSETDGVFTEYAVDMTPFEKAMNIIGTYCKPDVLVLVETTVPPGTCQKLVYPAISEKLKERGVPHDQFKLGHSYERVMPGPNYIDSIQNFYRVFSGVNEESADAVEEFLKTIISTEKYPLTRLGHTNATEMAKVLENSYRAMNIAFIVEWSRFAEVANVNLYEVVQAIRMRPTHANIMFPGIGVGGYCLTKDPLLASWSFRNYFEQENILEQSEKGVRINDQMPLYAYQFLRKYAGDIKGKNILLLGVSYRSDVGDTRYTPVESFYKYCQAAGAQILTHDPYVSFWDELQLNVEQDLEKACDNSTEIAIITTGHKEYVQDDTLIDLLLKKPSMLILDTIGILKEAQLKKLATVHNVKILGRGDI